MPKQLAYLEGKLKKTISKQIKRGRIEVFFSITGEQIAKRELHIDWDLADSYYRFIKQASARYELQELPTMGDLLQEQAYLSIEEEVEASSELERLVLETLARATERLDEMRSMEGAELLCFISNNISPHLRIAWRSSKLKFQIQKNITKKKLKHVYRTL